ncbi:hypothetical protein CCHR01_03991 [Colletotrichum chrysophilum]|uniref:Uncharacterized protein n=1 Tax=Colletotrichum chrysophilum TaxID=1836956 RepID=A0AAD9EIW1_9PEZI|nr:hypothetical protein CCHR01_03991 [Colletotrichum chrysophilum]
MPLAAALMQVKSAVIFLFPKSTGGVQRPGQHSRALQPCRPSRPTPIPMIRIVVNFLNGPRLLCTGTTIATTEYCGRPTCWPLRWCLDPRTSASILRCWVPEQGEGESGWHAQDATSRELGEDGLHHHHHHHLTLRKVFLPEWRPVVTLWRRKATLLEPDQRPKRGIVEKHGLRVASERWEHSGAAMLQRTHLTSPHLTSPPDCHCHPASAHR